MNQNSTAPTTGAKTRPGPPRISAVHTKNVTMGRQKAGSTKLALTTRMIPPKAAMTPPTARLWSL